MTALFHVEFGVVQPSRGDVLAKVAAYNAAATITTPGGTRYDFTRKSGEHVGGELIVPPDAPEWARDPATLWSAAEAAETRRDGQPARILTFTIPREIPADRRLEFARAVVAPFAAEGAAVQLDLHCPLAADGQPQPHGHGILSRRALTADGFAARKLPNEPWTVNRGRDMRGEIADRMNRWLTENGYTVRVDHRSHRERGDDTPPEPNISRRSIEAHKQRPDSAAAKPAAEMIAARSKRRELRAAKAELAAAKTEIQDLRETHDRVVPGVKSRRRAGRREIDPAWRPPTGGEITAVSEQRGNLRIDLKSGGRLYDRGNHVVAWRAVDQQAAAAALAEQAKRHGWTACEVTGPPAWRDQIAAALAARGITAANHTPPPAALEAARRHHAAQHGIAARDRFVAAGRPGSASANGSKATGAAAPPAQQVPVPKGAAPARRSLSATTSDSPPKTAPASDDRRRVQAWIGEQERRAAAEYSTGRLDADGLAARRLPRAAVAAGDAATVAAVQRGDLEAAIRAADQWKRQHERRRRAVALAPAPAPTTPTLAPTYRPSWATGPQPRQRNQR